MTLDLKQYFLLDPEVIFLNHGSFGACSRPVFKVYQEWQRKLEQQPVLFLGRQLPEYQRQARQILCQYLHTNCEDLVFVPNATYGVNIIAHSLPLKPGDEILTTDQEYGACNYAWELVCAKTGAKYIQQPIPLPLASPEEVAEQFWQAVTPRTKVIYLSHITSPTAQRLPVEMICRRARQAGILTLIDGAHAPGQIPLDLPAIGADFYTGNCHKWLLSPKGAGFLYAKKEVQHLVEPLVVSWGYHATPETTSGSRYVDYLQWTGTKDPAAELSVPAALQFMEDHNWGAVRQECKQLLTHALEQINALTGLPLLYTSDTFTQMAVVLLPPLTNAALLKERLYNEYKIEIPLTQWQEHQLLRISIQGYNSERDIVALLRALKILLPQLAL
jgi:isopenicillin-N epimerase